jgi:hypothetical protein
MVIDLDCGSRRRSDWAERDRVIVLTAPFGRAEPRTFWQVGSTKRLTRMANFQSRCRATCIWGSVAEHVIEEVQPAYDSYRHHARRRWPGRVRRAVGATLIQPTWLRAPTIRSMVEQRPGGIATATVLPFAGISFLWFIGVVPSNGPRPDVSHRQDGRARRCGVSVYAAER